MQPQLSGFLSCSATDSVHHHLLANHFLLSRIALVLGMQTVFCLLLLPAVIHAALRCRLDKTKMKTQACFARLSRSHLGSLRTQVMLLGSRSC